MERDLERNSENFVKLERNLTEVRLERILSRAQPGIVSKSNFKNVTKMLLERISWFCQERNPGMSVKAQLWAQLQKLDQKRDKSATPNFAGALILLTQRICSATPIIRSKRD